MRTVSERLNLEDAPDFFGPRELGRILGIAANRAYALANRADFPKKRIGQKILIRKVDFLKWWEQQN